MTQDINWLRSEFPEATEIHPLQEGGQKWVFSLTHSIHGSCVLKLLKPGANLYIEREIEVISRIPGAVPIVYSSGYIESPLGNLMFILEQQIEGETLDSRLKTKSMSKDEVIALTCDLVETAAQAELHKIVHRDVKPKNIIVDRVGKAWLIDFGIARILDMESMTGSDASIGPHSAGYSAPEQFRYQKRKIDGRADLFAIGVVSYEAAAGINPFIVDASDKAEVLHRVEKMPLPRLNLEWDADYIWADLISSFVQKFPHQRPLSVAEAQRSLARVLSKLKGH